MPNPNALVDRVAGVSRPAETWAAAERGAQFVTVSFQGGRSAYLDMSVHRSAVWADVLDSLRRDEIPAYVEIDPATGLITNLLAPLAVRVGDITPAAAGDAVEVELAVSHARHYLRRSNPDFERLLRELEAARERGTSVAVTETPTEHEIIDVQPLSNPPAAPAALEEPPPVAEGPVTAAAVTPDQARRMFELMIPKNCCPGVAAAPCIPFTYPDDGCWGRAHEMCRLMQLEGIQPNKVWIYGSPHPKTENHPNCQVFWGWHVAPTLDVATGGGVQTQVIDPSMFPGPVPQATWASAQLDPTATLIASPASVYYRNKSGSVMETDPTYSKTNSVLNTYRNQLKLRSVGSSGPPPYAACLAARPNVQFVGMLSAGATRSWFTYNWPAAWHVVWTMMPLTICWGTPSISWSVQVERASAAYATYWLVVRNLTAGPIRFEGRYDVLSR